MTYDDICRCRTICDCGGDDWGDDDYPGCDCGEPGCIAYGALNHA